MKNENFTTDFSVDADAQTVYDAINNVRGWWSENIAGETDQLNSQFNYHYQDVHRADIKVVELIPGKKVAWHVMDNYFKFTNDKTEWTGTDIIFEIFEKNGQSQLVFTHKGLVPTYECYNVCHDAWTHYIQDSLKSLVLTGKGNATPKEDGASEATGQATATVNHADAKSIFHRLLIKAPVEKVYAALTTQEGLAGWWTPDTTADAEVGGIATFRFGNDYFKEMKIAELKPYSRVQWVCQKAYSDWIGTTLTFELEPHQKGCVLLFHHDGWKNYTPEFASCSFDWAMFFRSLRFLCETGKGHPYPDFNQ